MTISKIDVLNKKFSRSMRGYSPEEVDLFMHVVAEALGEAADENRKLYERLADLERTMAAFSKNRQPPVQEALAAGRKIVEELKQGARREARHIIDEARGQAERIITDANLLKAKVLEETSAIRGQKATLERQLREVIEAHFRLLESSSAPGAAPDEGKDFIFAEVQE